MSKTKKTRELEYLVYDYLYLKRGLNVAMEVAVPPTGRADLVGTKNKEITIVEIKVSRQDFNSKHGHNFVGHRNYYAMPESLYKIVIDQIPKHVGVIVPYRNTVKVIKNARLVKHIYPKRYWEALYRNIDTAKQSNIRRLLYNRYKQDNKSKNKKIK